MQNKPYFFKLGGGGVRHLGKIPKNAVSFLECTPNLLWLAEKVREVEDWSPGLKDITSNILDSNILDDWSPGPKDITSNILDVFEQGVF